MIDLGAAFRDSNRLGKHYAENVLDHVHAAKRVIWSCICVTSVRGIPKIPELAPHAHDTAQCWSSTHLDSEYWTSFF
jgi:hypothetical protein